MKRIPLFVISILLLGLAALSAFELKNDTLAANSRALGMAEMLKLSDEELLRTKKDALDGSPEAGFRLVEYYSGYVRDDEQTMYWAQIAAENGDSEDAKNIFDYANFLSFDKGNIMSLIRARFWARRAIDKGDPLLTKLLLSDIDKQIKSLESKGSK